MANFVRRIVSGNKARFKDKHLGLELDLAYVTDNIIVMGFPAAGVEGLYRNRREDAKKFLDHRHGKNYWVFNFCPLRENSYPASFFEGRVSRYPFPDHHAPPLAILPLFVREVREWLSGSPDRVAVLHCKAGKGRSGTLACAYLLSLGEAPSPPKLQQNMTKKEWARRRADLIAETVEIDEMGEEAQLIDETCAAEEEEETASIQEGSDKAIPELPEHVKQGQRNAVEENKVSSLFEEQTTQEPETQSSPSGFTEVVELVNTPNERNNRELKPLAVEDILTLHTSRRMKAPSSPEKKLKQGVSIPSQRRWLYYWSLLLADAAPRGFWQVSLPRVYLREIRVRMHSIGGVKMNLLKIANHLIEKTNATKNDTREGGRSPIWVSLAQYDDDLVQLLEKWEKYTRSDDGNMAKKRKGSEYMPGGGLLREIFTDGKWDKDKMIRSFAHLGHLNRSSDIQRSEDERVLSHTLRPLTDKRWKALKEEMQAATALYPAEEPTTESGLTNSGLSDKNIVLDAAHEVCVKLYMGQIFMGWFWFIPAFHMHPPPSPLVPKEKPSTMTHLILTRKEIDFPLGAGAALIDVDVALEWVVSGSDAGDAEVVQRSLHPSNTTIKAEDGEPGVGPVGVVTGVQAAISGTSGREALEAIEGSDQ